MVNLDIVFRLVAAVILGGLVGLERESSHRPAGLRTHILVSLGSALIMVISLEAFRNFPAGTWDPGRLAAQVVSGIGFIGAGTILHEGVTIRGLTTAASLWVVAGIGLAVGAGYYFGALITTLLVTIVLLYVHRLENFFFPADLETIKLESRVPVSTQEVTALLGELGVEVKKLIVEASAETGTLKSVIIAMVRLSSTIDRSQVATALVQKGLAERVYLGD